MHSDLSLKSLAPQRDLKKLESQIRYLDQIGFKSSQLTELECERFTYYTEKARHSNMHVTDLWSVKDQVRFLKSNGLEDAEKERVKRAKLGHLSEATIQDRRNHDHFRDTCSHVKLPKLTSMTEQIRNKPPDRRRLETYSIYNRSHEKSLRTAIGSPSHFAQKLKSQEGQYFSPHHHATKTSKFEDFIDKCSKTIEENEDFMHLATRTALRSQHHTEKDRRNSMRIASKVRRILGSDLV
jgi:hypothetical protein